MIKQGDAFNPNEVFGDGLNIPIYILRRKDLTMEEKLVYGSMELFLDWADEECQSEYYYPSYEAIATLLEIDTLTVQKHLKTMASKNLLRELPLSPFDKKRGKTTKYVMFFLNEFVTPIKSDD